ncbi:Myb 1-like protein [Giardia muris]|uniref:Myb 1-like protein n=1 Tax=Giardia muris TaxID=5742 RepID=A0A4Z1T893_GIAMU|nr:Myb 1-like protein [Giardia muris]|eukprot:TNJ28809.1 Myb 1-like protein [Giardia muris]
MNRRWTRKEDEVLKKAVSKYGPHAWRTISTLFQAASPQDCAERWRTTHAPMVKGEFTSKEEERLLELYVDLNGSWDLIGNVLGRSARDCYKHYAKLKEYPISTDESDENSLKINNSSGQIRPLDTLTRSEKKQQRYQKTEEHRMTSGEKYIERGLKSTDKNITVRRINRIEIERHDRSLKHRLPSRKRLKSSTKRLDHTTEGLLEQSKHLTIDDILQEVGALKQPNHLKNTLRLSTTSVSPSAPTPIRSLYTLLHRMMRSF